MMPVLDGWAFIETYRRASGADMPIVSISANMSPAAVELLRRLGVPVCLAKPFELAELLDGVSRLIGSQASRTITVGEPAQP